MRVSLAVARVGLQHTVGEPMYVVVSLAMPLLMTWLMSLMPQSVASMASIGILLMFVALSLMTGAGLIIEERAIGTWPRLIVSPVARWELVLGMLIRLQILAWLQAAVLLLAGKYAFHVPWAIASGRIAVILAVYILCMTGLGIMLAGFLRSMAQVSAFSAMIVMLGTMLGGIFIPTGGSAVLETIAKLSPQGWAANALNDVLMHGASLASVSQSLVRLGVLALLFLAVGLRGIRFE